MQEIGEKQSKQKRMKKERGSELENADKGLGQ